MKCLNCKKEFEGHKNRRCCSIKCSKERKKKINKQYMKKYTQRKEIKKRIKNYGKKYRLKNKEKIKGIHEKWVKENKEKLKKYKHQYYLKNKKEHHKKSKEWFKKNPKKRSEYTKNYRDKEKNKANIRFWKFKHRQRCKNIIQAFTKKEWLDKIKKTKGICPKCKSNVGINKLTLDHIIPLIKAKKGQIYTIKDVQPLCRSCNAKKGMSVVI